MLTNFCGKSCLWSAGERHPDIVPDGGRTFGFQSAFFFDGASDLLARFDSLCNCSFKLKEVGYVHAYLPFQDPDTRKAALQLFNSGKVEAMLVSGVVQKEGVEEPAVQTAFAKPSSVRVDKVDELIEAEEGAPYPVFAVYLELEM